MVYGLLWDQAWGFCVTRMFLLQTEAFLVWQRSPPRLPTTVVWWSKWIQRPMWALNTVSRMDQDTYFQQR